MLKRRLIAGERVGAATGLDQEAAVTERDVEGVAGVGRERRSARDQGDRTLGLESRRLPVGSIQIGPRGKWILGLVQVLGIKSRIVIADLLGDRPMEGPPALAGEGGIDALPDEGVGKQKVVPLRPNEGVRQERLAIIVRELCETAHHGEGKALADRGGGTQRVTVGLGQTIETGENEIVDRGRQTVRVLRRIVEELLKEERIALGAGETSRDEPAREPGPMVGKALRIAVRQGSQVYGEEGRSLKARPPGGAERIPLDARGKDQKRRQPGDRACDRGEEGECRGVRPMQVLDDEEPRLFRARRRK
jgi:hypothetical protein